MKTFGSLALVACSALMFGCGSTAPTELVDARRAYEQARTGPAARLAPTELHAAEQALARAEAAFSDDSDSYRTLDLAYVAQRKAEMAEAQASIAVEQVAKTDSDVEYSDAQRDLLADQREELGQARSDLARAEQNSENLASQLGSEQDARRVAELESAKARAELSQLGELEDETRGTVITIPQSVLFRSNEAYLMPGADARLDLVVAALAATSDRNVIVEGHSDSEGSEAYNSTLTQRRADAIRDYLVRRGYPSGLIQARGMGEGQPVADNATSEGRSDNRRFQIIVERAAR